MPYLDYFFCQLIIRYVLLPEISLNISPKRVNYLLRRSKQKAAHKVEDLLRGLRYNSSSKSVVNKAEIRISGLRRSGNHAVINWLGKQVNGNSVFVNHVKPLENPYRDQYESQLLLGRRIRKEDWQYRNIDWWKNERDGNFSLKDCLIYSYEDQELEKVAHPAFERRHDLYLGKSQKRFDVIVLRDPFNLFASRLRTEPRKDGPNFSMLEVYSKRYSLPELWISYAKECLGETSLLKGKRFSSIITSGFRI